MDEGGEHCVELFKLGDDAAKAFKSAPIVPRPKAIGFGRDHRNKPKTQRKQRIFVCTRLRRPQPLHFLYIARPNRRVARNFTARLLPIALPRLQQAERVFCTQAKVNGFVTEARTPSALTSRLTMPLYCGIESE
jgi:hypothetical protein